MNNNLLHAEYSILMMVSCENTFNKSKFQYVSFKNVLINIRNEVNRYE